MARKEKRVATIDAETDPFLYGRTPKPFCWGFYDGETYADFWGDDCTNQIVEYLSTEDNLIIYAHNGGKFDFFYLLRWFCEDVQIINGRIARASLFDGKVELRDSYLIYPLALGNDDKLSIDYTKMERENRDLHKSEILRYLRQDCHALWDVVTNFRNEYGGGLTLAGAAFNQLKKSGYPAESTSEHFDEKFRPFYKGGRVQCFDTGAFVGDYIYVDIHSAYPHAMMSNHWQGSSFRETLKIPDRENGSYFARVYAVSKGALPYIQDGKTYYPDDNEPRWYNASGWEIIAGLETNTLNILKVDRCYLPTFTANFKAYVDRFFAMKAEADVMRDNAVYKSPEWFYWNRIRTFAKLMLNACYGKFGQDGRNFEAFKILEYGDVPEAYLKDGKPEQWEPYAEASDFISVFSRPDPSYNFYNVATASSVTGFVRAHLWKNICSSKTPLYCDTDAIMCKEFGGPISDELGDWGIEAKIKEAYIAQKKMYAILTDEFDKEGKPITKVASKGVRLKYDQIKEGVLSGKNVEFTKESPAFSLKFGARYTKKEIDFKNIDKNACNNPPDIDNGHAPRKKTGTKSVTHSLRDILCL